METIGIIGIGKLGLCFGLNLENAGYAVIGVDQSKDYIDSINSKRIQSSEPGVNQLLKDSINFTATTELSLLIESEASVFFIIVATPSLSDGGYDHSQILNVLQSLESFGVQKTKRHLVINCTTMPGFCESIVEWGKKYNYTITYNPEFIAQGNIIYDQKNPDLVLIGETDKEAGDQLEIIYNRLCQNTPAFHRIGLIDAEITKLGINCFLTTKIALANTIGDLALKSGGNPDVILNAIGTDSRIGKKYFNYGFGYGGPCFPRDNRSMQKFAKTINYQPFISEATDQSNEYHLNFQLEHYLKLYPENQVIEFDSVTYKKGTIILEESQQLALAVKLSERGRKVKIKEHPIVIHELKKMFGDLLIYEINEW